MPDAPAPRATPVAASQIAPDFTLPDQERKDWSLAQSLRQGDVVLCFFPFAFTGVCGTEMKCITKEMAQWKGKGATVVGVSCDSPFVQNAWAKAEGFQHTLLSDQRRSVTKAYGLAWPEMNTTRRATVVIGKSATGQGTIKWVEAREPGKAMDWNAVMSHV